MKKPDVAKSKKKTAGGMPDAVFAAAYPKISEYLVTDRWDDGSPRDKSTLTVFVEDNAVKLALNDKDLSQSLYIASGSLDGAFQTLERALDEGKHEWRPWNRGKKK